MFGRMRAAMPELNVDAAVAVSHPFTVNRSVIEQDLWTSVDDLNTRDDSGAGGMGTREMGAGVYYTHLMIDVDLLIRNLGGKADTAKNLVAAVIEAAATTTPSGHKTSFAHETFADYVRVELGDRVLPSLAPAFEKPVNTVADAVKSLREYADAKAQAYGVERAVVEMSVPDRSGTLREVLATVAGAL
jgi:CRISPR system Cascade subunit CasC